MQAGEFLNNFHLNMEKSTTGKKRKRTTGKTLVMYFILIFVNIPIEYNFL